MNDNGLCDYEISDGSDDPSFAWCGLPFGHAGKHGEWYGDSLPRKS